MCISQEDMKNLRLNLQEKYNLIIPQEITKVEMVFENNQKVYFRTNDKFEKAFKKDNQEYALHIFNGDDVRKVTFKNMDTLIKIFAALQKLNLYKLEATVNGEIIQQYIPT